MLILEDPEEILTWQVFEHKVNALLVHESLIQFDDEITGLKIVWIFSQHLQMSLFVLDVLDPLIIVNGGLLDSLESSKFTVHDYQVDGPELTLSNLHTRIVVDNFFSRFFLPLRLMGLESNISFLTLFISSYFASKARVNSLALTFVNIWTPLCANLLALAASMTAKAGRYLSLLTSITVVVIIVFWVQFAVSLATLTDPYRQGLGFIS